VGVGTLVGFLVGVLVGVDVGFFVGVEVGVEVAGKVGIAGAAVGFWELGKTLGDRLGIFSRLDVGTGVVGFGRLDVGTGVCAWSSRCCCNGADWDDDEEQLVDVQSS